MSGNGASPLATEIDALLATWAASGRVCPQPKHWQALWDRLPDTQRSASGWVPPLPLILHAWHGATDAEKIERLRVQLIWAQQHGALDQALAFLESLAPSDWYTKS